MVLMVMAHSSHAKMPRGRSIVLVQDSTTLGLRRVHLVDRLRARLCASRLHRTAQRRGLAVGLRNLVAIAQNPMRTRTPISREAVRQSFLELEAIAGRLESADPIDVCGVARVRWLLTDGASPFYGHTKPEQLKRELRTTLMAFDTAG